MARQSIPRCCPTRSRSSSHDRDSPESASTDLRHTHATLLLKAGVPIKVVSERLGHATPAFTMATYQHVLPGMQAEAARTFAALLAPAVGCVVPPVPPGGTAGGTLA
jgi:site-specific recombinase XerD